MTRGRPTGPRARRALTVSALVVAAALGAVAGGSALRAAIAPRPSAAVAALPVLRLVPPGVLDRAQSPDDRLGAPHGGGFVPGSVRRLAVMPGVPSVLLAARTPTGDVCLIAAVKQGRQYNASCVRPEVFAARGVSLQWSLSGWSAGEPFVEQGYLPRFFLAVWAPDGRIHYRTHVLGEG